jgi:hypothetical protein
MDINSFIPSFGDFMSYCKECNIEQDLFKKMLFEFLDNPKKYNNSEIIKNHLSEELPIDQYIQLISRMNL